MRDREKGHASAEALLGHDLNIGCSYLTRNPAQLGESERGRVRIGGNYSRGCIAPGREVHSDEMGTAERASVKTASLRSLAFVRLQRLSRKSSGCMLVHIVCCVRRQRNAYRICETGFVAASLLRTAAARICTMKNVRMVRHEARHFRQFAFSIPSARCGSRSTFGKQLLRLLRIR